jgi:hypothetical protein
LYRFCCSWDHQQWRGTVEDITAANIANTAAVTAGIIITTAETIITGGAIVEEWGSTDRDISNLAAAWSIVRPFGGPP